MNELIFRTYIYIYKKSVWYFIYEFTSETFVRLLMLRKRAPRESIY